MPDGPVPMDTTGDTSEMAGIIDATDPPTDPSTMDVDRDTKPAAEAMTASAAAAASAVGTATGAAPSNDAPNVIPITPQEEEEARQAIDLLRGDDVAGRVEAAGKLGGIAAALGVERTREVSYFIWGRGRGGGNGGTLAYGSRIVYVTGF